MGLVLLLLVATLAGSRAVAAEPPSSVVVPRGTASPPQDSAGAGLPVSLERIRRSLEAPPLLGLQLDEQPTFRVEVLERNRLQDLVGSLDVSGGPVPPGGVYGREWQRVTWPSTTYPLQQPYAAFSQPELATVTAEALAEQYLLAPVVKALANGWRRRTEGNARSDVAQAVADYCAAQPGGGAGIQICAPEP
jgi:hypothetical protein